MADFRIGDFLASIKWKTDFLGSNIQKFQRYALRHRWPTHLFTHILVIDGISKSMVSVAEQTAPLALRRWMEKDTLRRWLTAEKPGYFLYRPTFLIDPHGKAALQGYIDGRIHREARYDAQQWPLYWRNWFAHKYEGLPKEEHISKWGAFKDHPLEDTCSSFGAECLRVLMEAENEDFTQAFDGINNAEVAPSHFGNCPVLKRVVLQ